MRNILPLALLVVGISACSEQKNPPEIPVKDSIGKAGIPPVTNPDPGVNGYASVDVSPMDMSYYPSDYPKLKTANGSKLAPPVVRVVYSRPHLSRRTFDSIIKLNEPWRLGANESSEINFYQAVTIEGKKVNPGRYILYAIPHAEEWTIVLNTNTDTWGLKQDSAKDLHRFNIPVSRGNPSLEYFTMVFEKTKTGADLIIAWDDRLARLPLSFSYKQ